MVNLNRVHQSFDVCGDTALLRILYVNDLSMKVFQICHMSKSIQLFVDHKLGNNHKAKKITIFWHLLDVYYLLPSMCEISLNRDWIARNTCFVVLQTLHWFENTDRRIFPWTILVPRVQHVSSSKKLQAVFLPENWQKIFRISMFEIICGQQQYIDTICSIAKIRVRNLVVFVSTLLFVSI